MAATRNGRSKQEPGPESEDSHSNGRVSGEGCKMSLASKLMTSAILCGSEASAEFEHLYTMPILQTLGIPLSLVSMTALAAGPSASLLLLFIGWLSDRGSNPLRRKTAAIIFAAGLLCSGAICIIGANVLHLNYLLDYNSWVDFPPKKSEALFWNVPFKGGLGMLGIVLLDVGYDIMTGISKSFILACSPRSEHTSLLLLGLIMASAGGVTTAGLGVVDFASLFGPSHIHGGSLTIQTSVQALVVIVFVALGLLVTLLTGRRQLRLSKEHDSLTTVDLEISDNDNTHSYYRPRANSLAHTLENSIRSTGGGMHFDQTLALLVDNQTMQSSEHTPLLSKDEMSDTDEFVRSQVVSISTVYGTNEPTVDCSQRPTDSSEEDLLNKSVKNAETCQPGRGQSSKAKLLLISTSTYFSTGLLIMITLTSSDFVGKAIYGGDPEAAPDSESLARYREGLRMATLGFMVCNVTYLFISFVHPLLLAFLGCWVEFALAHLATAMSMMALALTVRLEAFFAMVVIAGILRACFFAVPFALAKDVVQAMSKAAGTGTDQLGLSMSLVSASIPLAYCTIFPWIGPLEDLTGNAAVPLWLGAGFNLLSVISFLCVGKP